MTSVLDGGTIGERIAERHAQFNNIGTSCGSCQYEFDTTGGGWVATHEVGDEYSPVFPFSACKGIANFCSRYSRRRDRLHSKLTLI